MACREFEMGKVMMLLVIPFAFLYFFPVLLQFVWQFSFSLVTQCEILGFYTHFGLSFKICVQMFLH